jgi:glutamate synthase domain-containing protein 2/glutamate synthase domain-containing protein 1/glutamate synthase domain-containing protein 3
LPRPTFSDRTAERDACGIGFVARVSGTPSHEVLESLLEALRRVRHRGAVAADHRTGDGAGVLIPLPPALLPEPGLGVAMVFLRDEDAGRQAVEAACAAEGIAVREWREVPVEPEALGPSARESMPLIRQAILERPQDDTHDPEWHAFHARKRLDGRDDIYAASLSYRTVVYKALCAADQLSAFYLDLADPAWEIPFGIFHQRFSTNTEPSWERAQPFRLLCHNGEINAIRGNVNWMRARQSTLGWDAELEGPVLDETSSDSGMLDNALELLVRAGRDIRHAFAMLIPPAWQSNTEIDADVRAFYRYHAGLTEPWDGPAGVVFTDGRVVGAGLDRNGLRPLRYHVAGDVVVCASEVGLVDLPEGEQVRRGRLGPGDMLVVDPDEGVLENWPIKKKLAAHAPYGEWLDEWRENGSTGEPGPAPEEDLTQRHALFGYTREELQKIIRPTAGHAHEPTSSMGDDTALPPLAGRARPLYSYFRQRFAQVTNPAIDHIRERFVMSLQVILGGRAGILEETPEAAAGIEMESFFLFPSALDSLAVVRLDATFDPAEGLEAACRRLGDAAEDAVREGHGMLLLTDADATAERPPVPMLFATAAVHHRLVRAGMRGLATLVVESDEPRETHHFACLLGFGAEAICPRLALETVAHAAAEDRLGGDHPPVPEAQLHYKKAIEDGVLKIMSKMGISDVASYCGAQIFEAIGLDGDLVESAFPGTPWTVGGVTLADLERETLERAESAAAARPKLENPGYVKFRKGGEPHETNPDVVDALHRAVRLEDKAAAHKLRKAVLSEGWEAYSEFAELVNGRAPMEVRDLLDFVAAPQPVPLDEVEPAEEIVKRFSAGGMSHGALSAEAHQAIAQAFNNLGARSNSGEGGEDPGRYRTNRNSRIKQIASGRFGVTAEYAAFASELQIKVAQGSKPGEGGQLPGHKVSDEIARLRHTKPGVALISPPPHHDIYSIEDLAQLIFDLKQVNPDADVSVKLVAEAGVGIVAAGVVKALADVVHIAGSDGGTGASPLSSIKNAGAPWELGLVETQHALVENGLRGRVRVRIDGGIKTGRDIVVAALLGADEISFGTALLLAEGCIMVRSCHLDTCPVGIATQRTELRAKFGGTPEMIESYLLLVAEEVRRLLASLGLRSFEEAVGRVDLLRHRTDLDERAGELVIDGLLTKPEGDALRYIGAAKPEGTGGELGREVAATIEEPAQERSYAITNSDRTVGALLGGRLAAEFPDGEGVLRRFRFEGHAGQSFGAFLPKDVEFVLDGEANDYVGKSLSGGRIVVHPPADDAGSPCLIGNTCLYGATSGELFCAGSAGARFAVRNSGATAVVEGVGDNACEYMTNGVVVVLGAFGRNLAAGMSGGEAFVHDPQNKLRTRLNDQLVVAEPVAAEAAKELRALLERHVELTGSAHAQELLANWGAARDEFRHIRPKADIARLEAQAEGTERHEEAAAASGGSD